MTNRPPIVTTHVYPPIPDRTHDWLAYHDGWEENTWLQGWGRTEAEAIADLQRIDAEEDEYKQDQQLRREAETGDPEAVARYRNWLGDYDDPNRGIR